MDEQPLFGGRTVGAVRIDDTVRKPVQPWTSTVHAVLRYLESRQFAGAPRARGIDEQNREILTYLEGETVGDRLPWPDWARSDSALRQVGTWLRRLHDVTATFTPPADASWFAGQTWRPGLVIGHHDVAPWNAVWRDGTLVGFVDWDTAGPSSRALDLAFAALSWVPLLPPDMASQQGFTASADRCRRLHLLLDSYGYDADRAEFGALVAARARMNASGIRRLAGDDPVYAALAPMAAAYERAADDVDELPHRFWSPISDDPQGSRDTTSVPDSGVDARTSGAPVT